MRRFSRAARYSLIVLGSACLSGCAAPTTTQVSGQLDLDPAADERIVIYPHFPCLDRQLGKDLGDPSIVLPAPAFQDAMYPWFEPALAPADAISFERLLGKPRVRARIDEVRVRYLIGLSSESDSSGFPGVFCGAGYGGAACLGVGWDNEQTSLSAVIWDFRKAGQAGAFSVDTTGTSLFLGVGIPIVFVADTEADACQAVADAIVDGLGQADAR